MLITPHFSVEEFACRDGTAYPIVWIDARLRPLCEVLEAIRAESGHDAIHIDSGYRTLAYDEKLYDASAKDGSVAPASRSQHPQGRAADITSDLLVPDVMFALVLHLFSDGKIPALGGVGRYKNFVHVDVRPRDPANPNHLAIWGGARPSNII